MKRTTSNKTEAPAEKQIQGINSRLEWLGVLEKIKPGIGKNPLLIESEMVIFAPEVISSFNDEISVSLPWPSGISGGVFAPDLYALLNKIKKPEIDIHQEEDALIVTSGSFEATLKIRTDISSPVIGLEEIKRWDKLPKDFVDAIGFCQFSVSNIDAHGSLTNLFVGGNRAISCDNMRATQYQMDASVKKDLLIPKIALKPLIAHFPNSVFLADNWTHFRNDENMVFSCRRKDSTYSTELIDKLFASEGSKVNLPAELADILDRTGVMGENEDKDRIVSITIKDNKLVCVGEKSRGRAAESAAIQYKGNPILFHINADLLRQILVHTNEMTVIASPPSLMFKHDIFQHVLAQYQK